MKVLMSPVNISGQPIELVKALKKEGVDAHLLQYNKHTYGYDSDKVITLNGTNKIEVQLKTLRECLDDDYDIFHFWFRTLFFHGIFERFSGFDLPFIKNRGKKIIYRFTGNDLRSESKHLKADPFSMFRYGYENPIDENMQEKYINFLKHYVDEFVVQDPEMQTYLPEASIIPRAINLDKWPFVGVKETQIPLIVHAPAHPTAKGTFYIRKALENLKRKRVPFEYKELGGMSHEEATALYKKADLIIDGMVAGWYGVFTVECMALGKPILVYIRDDLYKTFQPKIPLEKVNLNTLEEKIEELVTDFGKRKALALKERAFVEEVHDIKKVAVQLTSLYENVLKQPVKSPPNNFDDIDYFQEHFTRLNDEARKYSITNKALPNIKQKARSFDLLQKQLIQGKPLSDVKQQFNAMVQQINQLKRSGLKDVTTMHHQQKMQRQNQMLQNEVKRLKQQIQLLKNKRANGE